MERYRHNLKHLTAIVLSIAVAFVFTFVVFADKSYAASSSKSYYLPSYVEVNTEDGTFGGDRIKYDKHDNIKSAYEGLAIPDKFKITYRNSKGAIKSVTRVYDEVDTVKATYDKKGRITKSVVTIGKKKYTYKYETNSKGIIMRATKNGKLYYKIKSISYYKNGFVKKVAYSNGNVNYYNSDGLLTKIKTGGKTYTYKYTKKNGKVVKAVEYCNKKKIATTNFRYGKAKTKSVWKYSCAMSWFGGPSNAYELYGKSAQGGAYEF